MVEDVLKSLEVFGLDLFVELLLALIRRRPPERTSWRIFVRVARSRSLAYDIIADLALGSRLDMPSAQRHLNLQCLVFVCLPTVRMAFDFLLDSIVGADGL